MKNRKRRGLSRTAAMVVSVALVGVTSSACQTLDDNQEVLDQPTSSGARPASPLPSSSTGSSDRSSPPSPGAGIKETGNSWFYPYTGEVRQAIDVPDDATFVQIEAVSGRGAAAGGTGSGAGGLAGVVVAEWRMPAWPASRSIQMDIGGGGAGSKAGSSAGASGGKGGCAKAGGGGGATTVSLGGTVVVVVGGGGGGGGHGASVLTDQGGSGGTATNLSPGGVAGGGPAHGAGGAGGRGDHLAGGGDAQSGKNLGGCGGGGGGGWGGGGAGGAGSTGGGGGGGGGAGGNYVAQNRDTPVQKTSNGLGDHGDGYVNLTFLTD